MPDLPCTYVRSAGTRKGPSSTMTFSWDQIPKQTSAKRGHEDSARHTCRSSWSDCWGQLLPAAAVAVNCAPASCSQPCRLGKYRHAILQGHAGCICLIRPSRYYATRSALSHLPEGLWHTCLHACSCRMQNFQGSSQDLQLLMLHSFTSSINLPQKS